MTLWELSPLESMSIPQCQRKERSELETKYVGQSLIFFMPKHRKYCQSIGVNRSGQSNSQIFWIMYWHTAILKHTNKLIFKPGNPQASPHVFIKCKPSRDFILNTYGFKMNVSKMTTFISKNSGYKVKFPKLFSLCVSL